MNEYRKAGGGHEKPAAPSGPRRAESEARSTDLLDKMTPDELADVLHTFLAKHPELRAEAQRIAIDLIASPSVKDVADEVYDAVTSLGLDSLNGRAGKQAWGYTEPSEAAWELLGEAVEDVLVDMKRRADAGLNKAAEAICCGIVLGLHRVTGASSDGPMGWAPDFPADEACEAVSELIRIYPPKDRRTTRNRLVEALVRLVPSWDDMVKQAADQAIFKRQ